MGAFGFFGVLELSFSLDFGRLLFDRYPLERSSASYQKDLRPIVLGKNVGYLGSLYIISGLLSCFGNY